MLILWTLMRVAGFVLTGGDSTRMQQDKALLPVGSKTLCERIGDVLHAVAEQVLLIGHPERYGHLKHKCVADRRPGLGPLSGLETALALELAEWNVVSSCDAYNLKSEWLHALLLEAEQNGALCTVAQDSAGNVQPLCGVYRSGCLPTISQALSQGRLRAMDLLKELKAKPVRVNGMILNLNTPEQYEETLNAERRE